MPHSVSGERIEALDIAKAFGILLVVFGHTIAIAPNLWIFSFHVPLFFMLAGICAAPHKFRSFGTFVAHRSRTLLLPTLFFTLCLSPVYELGERLIRGEHFPMLWFLYALYFSEIIYFFIARLDRSVRFALLLTLYLGSYGCATAHLQLPFHIENLGSTLFYYGFGHTFMALRPTPGENTMLFRIIGVHNGKKNAAAAAVLLFPMLPIVLTHRSFNISINEFPPFFPLFAIASIVTSVAVIYCADAIGRSRPLSFVGTNTLLILALHGPLLLLCSEYLLPYIPNKYVYAPVAFALSLSGCLMAAPIFNRYLPWAVGKKRKLIGAPEKNATDRTS